MRPVALYIVVCPFLGQVFSALSETGDVRWFWVVAGGIVASSVVALGLRSDNPAEASPSTPMGQDKPATGVATRTQSFVSGALAAAIIYLIYQLFLMIQAWAWSEIIPAFPNESRMFLANAAQLVVFLQTQFLVAVLAIVLGTSALGIKRNLGWGAFGAVVLLVLATLVPHLVFIALGYTAYLDKIAQFQELSLASQVQGLFLTWGVLIGALCLGGVLARLASLLKSRH